MEEKTLLILAAGMGSRFGGLKQIEPIDENGNFIIDYSIYDAIRAGFNKVVFIIKEENFEIFKETVGKRIEKYISVDYAFQDLSKFVPENLLNCDRQKPWGTGHAVLCAKDKVVGDFTIINADDFYGFDAYKTAFQFFQEKTDNKYGIVAYEVGNTLTDKGGVKRGVCEIQDKMLVNMTESVIEKKDGKIFATPLNSDTSFEMKESDLVSMNMMCLNSNFFNYLENYFKKFLENCKDYQKDECLIQNAMFSQTLDEGTIVQVVPTNSKWYGVTYKEDLPKLKADIKALVDKKYYPNILWPEK